MRRISQIIVLAVVTLTVATAQSPKISPDLEGLKPGTKVDVIIQFVNPAMENDIEKVSKAGGHFKRYFESCHLNPLSHRIPPARRPATP